MKVESITLKPEPHFIDDRDGAGSSTSVSVLPIAGWRRSYPPQEQPDSSASCAENRKTISNSDMSEELNFVRVERFCWEA